MGFKRGHWRCAVAGCGADGEISFMVTASTAGSRRERVQVYSKCVRLCTVDSEALALGGQVPALTEAIRRVVESLTLRSSDNSAAESVLVRTGGRAKRISK